LLSKRRWTKEAAVIATTIPSKSGSPVWMFFLAALAALGLAWAWSGAGRTIRMQTRAPSNAEFVQLKPQDDARIVLEVVQSAEPRIAGILLEKYDETHYSRSHREAEVVWGKSTKFVMGKAEDVHRGAIIHVSGKVAAERSVSAEQIVILTGYVEVK
jgi:hypothetical protein